MSNFENGRNVAFTEIERKMKTVRIYNSAELEREVKQALSSTTITERELTGLVNQVQWSTLKGSVLAKQLSDKLVEMNKQSGGLKIQRKPMKCGTMMNPVKGEVGYEKLKKRGWI